MRNLTRLVAIALLIAAAAVAAAAPEASPESGTLNSYKGWNVRWGIAASPEKLLSLIGAAEAFGVDLLRSKDVATGENLVLGFGEAHGVFAVPLESAVAVVVDYANLKAISPRVREVRIYESGPPRWHVYEDIGVNFLGISVGYRLDAETLRDDLPGGAVGLRGRLLKSHDGKLYGADSSWYFARLTLAGKEYTYIRTYSTSGLREPGVGVAGILKLFTAGDLRDQIASVARVASALHP